MGGARPSPPLPSPPLPSPLLVLQALSGLGAPAPVRGVMSPLPEPHVSTPTSLTPLPPKYIPLFTLSTASTSYQDHQLLQQPLIGLSASPSVTERPENSFESNKSILCHSPSDGSSSNDSLLLVNFPPGTSRPSPYQPCPFPLPDVHSAAATPCYMLLLKPNALLPQDICICYSLCLKCSSPRS